MKIVRDVIRRTPVWVNPEHTVESAIVLMRGHNVGGLPVLEAGRLVGMVEYADFVGADKNDRVGDIMSAEVTCVSPGTSVRDAADIMAHSSTGRLAVVDEGQLIGIVTDGDLLPELGRNYDPLTDLPWSDGLREWAIEHLKHGAEITVLFIDLDKFGQFNKVYGHTVGDEVLQAISTILINLADPEVDFLCRYGGDEFCIASIRTADESAILASAISRRVDEINVPTLQGDRVSCSIGQYGGKRTREREHVHYAATLNSLINLASRACTANKKREGPSSGHTVISMGGAETGTRLRLARIEVQWDNRTARVQVDLQSSSDGPPIGQESLILEGLNRFSASMTGDTDGEGVLKIVAETTVAALRSFLPAGYDLILTDVVLNQIATGQTIITAVGHFAIEGHAIPVAGSAVLGDDPYRAAASSVLAAVNRPMSRVVARQRMENNVP